MDYKLIIVNDALHKVKHTDGVGYYVDIDGEATTKPTKAELFEELQKRYQSVSIPKGP